MVISYKRKEARHSKKQKRPNENNSRSDIFCYNAELSANQFELNPILIIQILFIYLLFCKGKKFINSHSSDISGLA